jgi:hypothetical protein
VEEHDDGIPQSCAAHLAARRTTPLTSRRGGSADGAATAQPTREDGMQSRLTGWWVFAAILLGISGILNVIWGIAAIGNSHFFTANAHYIFSNLNTWGWITLIIGVVEIIAGFSLMQGGGFGKAIGIIAAALASIDALLSIPAAPFWSLCVFALSIIIIYELAKTPEVELAR